MIWGRYDPIESSLSEIKNGGYVGVKKKNWAKNVPRSPLYIAVNKNKFWGQYQNTNGQNTNDHNTN